MQIFAENARLLFALSSIAYLAAFAAGLPALGGRRPARILMGVCIVLAFVMQSLALNWRGMQARSCPIGNPFEIFQFITWSLIVLYGFVGSAFRTSLLGFFTAGLAALLSVTSLLMPGWDSSPSSLFGAGLWVELHAALSIFSYGAFGLLALASGMYLLQVHGLRKRHLEGLFEKLPSLVELERVCVRLLILSTAVYSLALAAGIVAWAQAGTSVANLKLLFTVLVWAGYALTLLMRVMGRLFPQRLAIACIALFGWSLLSLYPVELGRVEHATAMTAAEYQEVSQ